MKQHRNRPLSATDERVFTFIRSFQLTQGRSPNRQEIADGLKLPHRMYAHRSVLKLQARGRLQESGRGIQIKASTETSPSETIQLPLLGAVAAGRPIEAIEGSETIAVPSSFVRNRSPHFVLRVRGESMIEDHICDGDYVIIRQQLDAANGDKVVALIDGEATLKRFYRKPGRIELHPANSRMKPIVISSEKPDSTNKSDTPTPAFRIAGVFVGLLRIET